MSPAALPCLRRVPSAGQMNAGRTKTRGLKPPQTVCPALRHSSIRLRRRRHGDGGMCSGIRLRFGNAAAREVVRCARQRGANNRAPRPGGRGCAGVRSGNGDGRSRRAVECAMPAAGDRRFCLLFSPEKSKASGGTRPAGSDFDLKARGKLLAAPSTAVGFLDSPQTACSGPATGRSRHTSTIVGEIRAYLLRRLLAAEIRPSSPPMTR